jgi:hypothetical protein
MSQLPNIQAATTTTLLLARGNANAGSTVFDAQAYKGPLTFVFACGQITSGLGAAHVNVANVMSSADNTTFAEAGAFTGVVNAANASNATFQTLSFDARQNRYWRANIEVSGTNANLPLTISVIGQLERV